MCADTVAAYLAMDRRTLNRHLANEGTCFRDLVEEKRKELVVAHLAGKRKLSEIAELVGLASASGLSHWCRRHFDRSSSDFGGDIRRRSGAKRNDAAETAARVLRKS